jgi:hypothetical protein
METHKPMTVLHRPPGNQKLLKHLNIREFMQYNETTRSWSWLGGTIEAKNYRSIMNILESDNNDYIHKNPNKVKGPCIICAEPSMRYFISDCYCDSCFAWFNVIAHNNGEVLDIPDKLKSTVDSMPPIAGKTVFMEFKSSEATPKANTITTLTQKIFLGGHKGVPSLFIGKSIIPLNPDNVDVTISKVYVNQSYGSKIDILIKDDVYYNGQLIHGKFNKCGLLGNTVCENAYIGECVSMYEHKYFLKESDMENPRDGYENKAFPNPLKLNEVITNPGVVGIIQPKKLQDNGVFCPWINIGKYCPRCAERNTTEKNATSNDYVAKTIVNEPLFLDKVVSKLVPREEYDRVVTENKELREKNETLQEDVKALRHLYKRELSEKSDEKNREQLKAKALVGK